MQDLELTTLLYLFKHGATILFTLIQSTGKSCFKIDSLLLISL